MVKKRRNKLVFAYKQFILMAGCDLLRIPEKYQKYRYAKKTQISLDPKKYRYVGDTTSFRV
jgi:hypothetical protein